jgi:cation:H+ antiporter
VNAVSVVLFIVGLLLLVAGAELLVRGATRLAGVAGVSPLVIGLTVVAFGTSSPELAVSMQAALAGRPELAVGNVVGSNIFNVLFILGLSALVAPLIVDKQLIRWDVPLMIGASVALLLVGLDGRVGRLDGLVLAAGLLAYVAWSVRQSRRQSAAVQAEYAAEFAAPPGTGAAALALHVAFIVAGLATLVVGAHWLVNGAAAIARALGMSELVIGLTVVAAGTSLPEVATSVVASLKGERDIAVGNVVGSNLFNILGVLGLSAAVSAGGVHVPAAALRVDMPVMIGVAVVCLPIFFTGHRISRGEGVLLVALYLAYTAFLVLSATRHALLPLFTSTMLAFVLPAVAFTLTMLAARAYRDGRNDRADG